MDGGRFHHSHDEAGSQSDIPTSAAPKEHHEERKEIAKMQPGMTRVKSFSEC